MTEQHVATTIHRLLGERVPHLADDIAQTTVDRPLGPTPAQAVAVNLTTLRSRAWGTLRRFTTIDSIHIAI